MTSPFPGMDPWLESAEEWPGFHDTLIVKSVECLQPQLKARGYYAKCSERVWLSHSRGIVPDVATISRPATGPTKTTPQVALAEADEPVKIAHVEMELHEGFVEIYQAASHELVTCIEYLSPSNKLDRQGRELYQRKQQLLGETAVHLIEIDLIRRGPHVLDIPEAIVDELRPWSYLVNLVRRGTDSYEVYPIGLKERLPRLRIPLRTPDDDAVLDLQEAFNRSYEIGPYPECLDYKHDPPPPALSEAESQWINTLLRDKGIRE